MSETNFNYLLKYIIIGDSAVGKSNILTRYVYEKFNEEFQSTIGVEFASKNAIVNNKIYRIQIWDTAGQESFRSITRAYYKNSVCAFIVYDITSRTSFENVKSWLDDIQKQCPKTTFLVLVGNKIDLENERQIMYEEGDSFAKENNMLYIETSAKTGQNIETLFLKSVEIINEKIENGYYDLSNPGCGIKKGLDESNNNNIILNKENLEKGNNNGGKCCYYY
jgi:small GTP-binding protein